MTSRPTTKRHACNPRPPAPFYLEAPTNKMHGAREKSSNYYPSNTSFLCARKALLGHSVQSSACTSNCSRLRGKLNGIRSNVSTAQTAWRGVKFPTVLMIATILLLHSVDAFIVSSAPCTTKNTVPPLLSFGSSSRRLRGYYSFHPPPRRISSSTRVSEKKVIDESEEEVLEFGDGSGVVIDDLNWRVAKMRLEEENKRRFLKSKPRFLPYDDCRKWVQAWGGRWQNEEDWHDWIAMGEKRNAYIPSRPDEYYGDKWISWDHFLGTGAHSATNRKKKSDDGEDSSSAPETDIEKEDESL